MSTGFMRYEMKNGVEYASVYHAKREDGKKVNDVEYLGRVIDKQKGIFQSRKRGTFQYSLGNTAVEYLPSTKEKLILNFGDSYFLHEMLVKLNFIDLLKRVFGATSDSLLSLIFYKTLRGGANSFAKTWWEGSYTRILFPSVSLASQRITEILKEIGDEKAQRYFFREYLKFISPFCGGGILVDSTGLPNDINFPLTAINNHNGVISNESRLVFVLDRKTKVPIFFRYVAGNIVDVSTLDTTITEVKAFGIDVKHAIVDAGYYSESNIRAMQRSGISFLLRMSTNRKLYNELLVDHAVGLEDAKNLVKYRNRFVYIKRVKIDLFGSTGYAYVAEDIDRKHDEIKKYMNSTYDDMDITFAEMNAQMQYKGFFILISSDIIETQEILPLYYTRQAIEQVFDISKNCADLLPLRVHSVEAFRGHLLLSFIISAAYIFVDKMLKDSNVNATEAYYILHNLMCKVYDDKIIVQEANKKMNDIAKAVEISFPMMIST